MTYDKYDAEWENQNTGRTVAIGADDLDLTDFCPVCRTLVAHGDCPECLSDQADEHERIFAEGFARGQAARAAYDATVTS